MQVHGARPDGATAGKRHPRPPGARQQRPQRQHRGAHLAHQVVRRRVPAQFRGAERQGPLPAGARLDPELAEKRHHGRDVADLRQVVQGQRVFAQKRGREQRQRRVFRAGDGHRAVQRPASADPQFVHRPAPAAVHPRGGSPASAPALPRAASARSRAWRLRLRRFSRSAADCRANRSSARPPRRAGDCRASAAPAPGAPPFPPLAATARRLARSRPVCHIRLFPAPP